MTKIFKFSSTKIKWLCKSNKEYGETLIYEYNITAAVSYSYILHIDTFKYTI
jgi:hypothetical protein